MNEWMSLVYAHMDSQLRAEFGLASDFSGSLLLRRSGSARIKHSDECLTVCRLERDCPYKVNRARCPHTGPQCKFSPSWEPQGSCVLERTILYNKAWHIRRFSQRRTGFAASEVHVGIMVDGVAQGQYLAFTLSPSVYRCSTVIHLSAAR
jgi:hypothetical protein